MLVLQIFIYFFNHIFWQHKMMESLSFEEENISKDIKNLFRLKKEPNYTTIKNIRNLLQLEKETKAIKDRDNKNRSKHEEEK